jgi:hypothetical protein
MPTTFGFTLNFGDGDPLTTAKAEIMDQTGTVFQTILQAAMVDVSGTTPPSGRVFGGEASVPDGVSSGFYRGRDNLTPELILEVLPFNIFQSQASIIVVAPPIPTVVLPGDSVSIAFGTVTLPSGDSVDATGTPTAILQRNGVTDVAVHPTVTRTGTASYSASVVVPSTYIGTDSIDLAVSSVVAGVTVMGIPIFHAVLSSPPAIALPGTVELYGYEFLNGTPVVGRTVKAELLEPPQSTSTVILEVTPTTATSGSDGRWRMFLIPGKDYRLLIPEAGIDFSFTVPNIATDARTLLP